MMSKATIATRWLERAKSSPSGGNVQPWIVTLLLEESEENFADEIQLKVEVDQNELRNKSPLDINGSATIISLGCFTTTLKYVALIDGYHLSFDIIDDKLSFLETKAILSFQFVGEINVKTHSLETILNRATNREPFANKEIPIHINEEIQSLTKAFGSLRIFQIQDKKKFFNIFRNLENIRWRRNDYTDSLMDEISDETNPEHFPNKIPLDQLGLSYMDRIFFKSLKKNLLWRRICQMVSFPIFASKSIKNYLQASNQLHFIQAKKFNAAQCFEIGLLFQELWLMAEKNKLAFQPLGSILVLNALLFPDKDVVLSLNEKKSIQTTVARLSKLSGEDFNFLSLGFRLGVPNKTTSKSPRKAVNSFFRISREKLSAFYYKGSA